jgi:transcriptional regulator with XRE-family HTH domain
MIDALEELKEKIDAKMPRADFAKAVGIGKSYLSQILSGKRQFARLPIETGRKISEMSGISLDRLAGTAGAEDVATAPLAPSEGQP